MKKLIAIAALATVLAPAAQAESLTKPGLWDMTLKMTYNKGGPKMSPEELAMMKQMGIDMSNMKMQRCITPQQAQEEFDPSKFNDDDSGCSVLNPKHSGGKMSGDYVCNGKLKGRGVVEATASSTGFTSYFTFVGTSSDAQMGNGSIDMRTDITGQFLKADCGSAGGPPAFGKGMKLPGHR